MFLQDLITNPARWTYTSETAILPVAKSLPTSSQGTQAGVLNASVIVDDLWGQTLMDFFHYNVARTQVEVQCPTSNCTWDPFDTLGICISCKDVTPSLIYRCQKTSLDWVPGATVDNNDISACGYFLQLPQLSPKLVSGYAVDVSTSQPTHILNARSTSIPIDVDSGALSQSSRNSTTVMNIARFAVSITPNGVGGVLTNATPAVSACTMSFCMKRFHAYYSGGNLTQYAETASDSLNSMKSNASQSIANALEAKLQPLFSFVSTSQNMTTLAETSFVNPQLGSLPSLSLLDSSSSFPDKLQSLAKAMTTDLQNGFEGTQQWLGTAWNMENFVEVVWGSLIYPFVIEVLAIVFLSATIYQSSLDKDKVGVWKNSLLAVLQHGFDAGIKAEIGEGRGLGAVRQKAKGINMSIV